MTIPTFIDFEASSLNTDSYPIEVAWNYPDGSVESHLINPDFIEDWSDWDAHAQCNIHGIDREDLRKEGKDPNWVCDRMREALGSTILHSDGAEFDGFWLSRLFESCHDESPFLIRDAIVRIKKACPPSSMLSVISDCDDGKVINSLEAEARKRAGGVHHRAGSDVQYLVELYKLIRRQTEEY